MGIVDLHFKNEHKIESNVGCEGTVPLGAPSIRGGAPFCIPSAYSFGAKAKRP